jgi:hypothetical protein
MVIDRRQFFITGSLPLAAAFGQSAPKRLARKDCYFGLHFDLHPSKSDTALGRDVTDRMVDELLKRVRPDYVQYDCKGHVGYLGYPSKVGTSAPGIVKDSLEIWRRITAQHGVGLYIHFSGVWDGVAVAQHPEWARVQPDGKPDERNTSTFGPYVDKLMIPQLSEAIAKYSLDGAWVDGECWSTAPDYGEAAQRAWRERTGSSTLPRNSADPGWLDFLEMNREQFRKYVRHYVDELHRRHPGVEIASNWLYSSFVPELPEIPVDYLSGDFLGGTPISTAHVEARYLAATGKPWDLMAWGFVADRTANTKIHKTAAQLKQEAAAVISQGGGFEVYYNPTRAGWIDDRLVSIMEDLGAFCRARKDVSFQTEPVPQAAVLFSKHSLYAKSNRMFGGWGGSTNPARGTIDALLAAHYSVEILPDWKLSDASRFPLIVVPDWGDIGVETRDALAKYVTGGGSLIVLGAENAALFAQLAGVRVAETREQEAIVFSDSGVGAVKGLWANVEPASADVILQRFATVDPRRDGLPGAILARSGNGKLVMIPGPLGAIYARYHAAPVREFLARAVDRVFTPAVTVTGPSTVEIALRRKQSRWLLHLANMTGAQAGNDYITVDSVAPVGPLTVALRLPRAPQRVVWEPGGMPIQGRWQNGTFQAAIPRLEIHGVLAVEI